MKKILLIATGGTIASEEKDMTTEALTMKLMWALGNYDNVIDVKKYIETPCFADRSY